MKNIIFLTHAEKGASGGGKYIYRYSQIINNFKNFSSEVIHIKKKKISKFKNSIKKIFKINKKVISGWQLNDIAIAKNFTYKWLKHNIKIKEDFIFSKKNDFVILPEIFAHFADKLLIKKNIDYAILIQNGYSINSTNDEKSLKIAYQNAKFILSISKDTSNCIKLRFPKIKHKILKASYCIDVGRVNFNYKKNIITYMSRKLSNHSYIVTQYLRANLNKNWTIKNLHNFSEKKTYKLLKQSKVFLSFSNLEGFGLPPLEAALAGNIVIGYTGEGGSEYWQKPIFIKVNSGEVNKFANKIIECVNKFKLNQNFSKSKYDLLKKKFSEINEIKSVKNFLKFI